MFKSNLKSIVPIYTIGIPVVFFAAWYEEGAERAIYTIVFFLHFATGMTTASYLTPPYKNRRYKSLFWVSLSQIYYFTCSAYWVFLNGFSKASLWIFFPLIIFVTLTLCLMISKKLKWV